MSVVGREQACGQDIALLEAVAAVELFPVFTAIFTLSRGYGFSSGGVLHPPSYQGHFVFRQLLPVKNILSTLQILVQENRTQGLQ
jgi:hypothetical protein